MEQVFNFDNLFKAENKKSLFYLEKCLVSLANGTPITDQTASRKIIESLNDLFSPTLVDYSHLDRLKGTGTLAHSVITKPKLSKTVYIDEEERKGFEFSSAYLDRLVTITDPAEQTKFIFELINSYFHEADHINDFLRIKNEYSLGSLDSALATISTHRNLEHYNKNYSYDTNECSARYGADYYTRKIISRFMPRVQQQADDSDALDKFTSVCNAELQQRQLGLAVQRVYSHFPIIASDSKLYPRITFDALNCKNIVAEHPELVQQFGVLRLKYNPDGTERSILTLLKERQLTLDSLAGDEVQLNNATCFYNGLIYQRLLSAEVFGESKEEFAAVAAELGQAGIDAALGYAKDYAVDWTTNFTNAYLALKQGIDDVKDHPENYEQVVIDNLSMFEDIAKTANGYITDKDQIEMINCPFPPTAQPKPQPNPANPSDSSMFSDDDCPIFFD